MPTMKGITSTVARCCKLKGVPKNMANILSELVIPECFQNIYTSQGPENFLYFDSGENEGNNRFLDDAHAIRIWKP